MVILLGSAGKERTPLFQIQMRLVGMFLMRPSPFQALLLDKTYPAQDRTGSGDEGETGSREPVVLRTAAR